MSENAKGKNEKVFAKIKVQAPEDVQVELSVTMSMGDWVRLHEALPKSPEYPFPKFRRAVEEVIRKAKNSWDYDSRSDFFKEREEGEK